MGVPFLVLWLIAAAPAWSACPPKSAIHVLARSGKTRVYGVKRERVFEGAGGIYACRYPRGKPHRLNRQGTFGLNDLVGFTFAGHFVAFEEDFGSAAGGAAYDVVVRDLRDGRLVVDLSVSERGGDLDDSAEALLLKPNGSVAWLASTGPPGDSEDHGLYEIHVADRDGVRMLDQDTAIAPDSLRLSADHRHVSWLHANERRTASIR
jgi:hypothetical protein